MHSPFTATKSGLDFDAPVLGFGMGAAILFRDDALIPYFVDRVMSFFSSRWVLFPDEVSVTAIKHYKIYQLG